MRLLLATLALGLFSAPYAFAACQLNRGPTPNACVDNHNPSAGSTIHVTVVGTARTNAGRISLNYYNQNNGGHSSVTINGDGVYAMTIPIVRSDRPIGVQVQVQDSGGGYISSGDQMMVSATTAQPLGNALPPSVSADPFTPQHVILVCKSGCQFTQPWPAISFAQSNKWDFVEITIEAGDYFQHNHDSDNFIMLDTTAIPHIWIKGIIGNSGTDGTVFPHLFGSTESGGNLFSCRGNGHGIIDNIEFGPWFGGWISGTNCVLTTLRNVYVHDSSEGLISGDTLPNSLEVFNSHFARNGGNGGSEHNLYQGLGDGNSFLHIKNSIFEQAFLGHDVKTRSKETDIDNSKLILNADNVYKGSEVIDASNGYILRVHNTVMINGDTGNDFYSDDQSFDMIRFSADDCCGPHLPDNFVDAQSNVFISDGGTARQFINLFKSLTPSPPYPARGNKFVFRNAAQYNNGTSNGTVWQRNGGNGSALVFGAPNHPPGGNAFNIDLGQLGTDNVVYPDRVTAGLPAVGTYPKAYNDPAYNVGAARGADYVGNVKIPAS
jgi:hypothetical protein